MRKSRTTMPDTSHLRPEPIILSREMEALMAVPASQALAANWICSSTVKVDVEVHGGLDALANSLNDDWANSNEDDPEDPDAVHLDVIGGYDAIVKAINDMLEEAG